MDNWHLVNEWHNYMLQPGDGTMYRLGFCYYPENPEQAYVLDEGVGPDAHEEYIKFYINMPGGTGMGVVMIVSLKDFPDGFHLIGYLRDHGLREIHIYTLIAVLQALKVLVDDPNNLAGACTSMLETRHLIYEFHKGQDK